MSAVLLGRWEVESPEWYAARENGLGGSEIASVIDGSPWTSRYTLWHRKAGRIGEQEVSESMDWGKRLEEPIIAAWLEDHPDLFPMPGGTFAHEDRPWQIANPDKLVSVGPESQSHALLEVKTASAFSAHEWGKTGTDVYPRYYADQVQWYLDVFGFKLAYLVVLIGGNDLRWYEIKYDAARAEFLRDAGERFLLSVAEGIPPDLDGSTSTYEAVREMHPDIDSTAEVVLSSEQYLGLLAARQAKDEATAAHNLACSQLLEHMGSARHGLFLGEKVVRREAKGQGKPYLKLIPQPKASAA